MCLVVVVVVSTGVRPDWCASSLVQGSVRVAVSVQCIA